MNLTEFKKEVKMKKKKYTCSICGMKLSEESIIRNIGGDKEFCRWCAKKENWCSSVDCKVYVGGQND